jgi:hypothetical protein
MNDIEKLYNSIKLTTRKDKARPRFKFTKDFCVKIPDGRCIHIPKNYETDFATIPKFAWNLFPPIHEGVMFAALAHDYLYDKWRSANMFIQFPEAISRKWCDQVFLDMCDMNWRKYVMYWALRLAPKAKRMYED